MANMENINEVVNEEVTTVSEIEEVEETEGSGLAAAALLAGAAAIGGVLTHFVIVPVGRKAKAGIQKLVSKAKAKKEAKEVPNTDEAVDVDYTDVEE